MARILELQGLAFDDVLLVPSYSPFESRSSNDIDLSVQLTPNIKLDIPIISANMSTVTEDLMAKELFKAGGIGFIHRYLDQLIQQDQLRSIYPSPAVITVGVNEESKERAKRIYDDLTTFHPEQKLAFLIDIAHGHSKLMYRMINFLKKNFPNTPIIAGNVCTYKGAIDLIIEGVHTLKIGVGNGSLCTTRVQTGNGVPQITAIMECRKAIEFWYERHPDEWQPTIIADGGIRNSGDCTKALAAGANAVMVGNLFAGTAETPGQVHSETGDEWNTYKVYRGMASKEAQEEFKGSSKNIEGVEVLVRYKGSVKKVLTQLVEGIRSGFSYQGAHNIRELQEKAVFIRQTQAGYLESIPHAKLLK